MTKIMLGQRIKTFRRKRAMTQTSLAALLAITPQAVQRWERGLVDIPSSRLWQIAVSLQCSVEELLADPEETPHG